MPNATAYVRTRSVLQEEILRRVAAGELVSEVCGAGLGPCVATVWNWARRDAAFGAALAQARVQGDWVRRFRFDDAKAEAMLGRLRAGERLDRVLADPAMPSRETLRYWMGTQGAFGAEVRRLRAVRRQEVSRALGDHPKRPFDQAVADKVYLAVLRGTQLARLKAVRPDLPSRKLVDRWREENSEFDQMMRFAFRMGRRARRRPTRGLTRQRAEAILMHIRKGGSLLSYSRRRGAPCVQTLYRWVQMNDGFAAQVAQACDDREDTLSDLMFEAQERAASRPGATMASVRRARAPWSRQLARLQNRPGKAVWAKRSRP